jgi:hypothetical protein
MARRSHKATPRPLLASLNFKGWRSPLRCCLSLQVRYPGTLPILQARSSETSSGAQSQIRQAAVSMQHDHGAPLAWLIAVIQNFQRGTAWTVQLQKFGNNLIE